MKIYIFGKPEKKGSGVVTGKFRVGVCYVRGTMWGSYFLLRSSRFCYVRGTMWDVRCGVRGYEGWGSCFLLRSSHFCYVRGTMWGSRV